MALIVEVTEALLVLNIQSDYIITKDIEAAYYKAVAKYHLPHNPAWLEMRKITLVAYNILMAQNLYKINKIACLSHDLYDYGEIINIALNKVVDLPNLSIEIDRAWVRINGNTEAYREVLTQAGFCQGEGTVWFFQPWNRMESIGK